MHIISPGSRMSWRVAFVSICGGLVTWIQLTENEAPQLDHTEQFVLILERVASHFSRPLLRDISGEEFDALSLNSPMLILGESLTLGAK